MEPVDTIQISQTVRVQLFHDDHASNPLDNWDHGIQFITLPDPSRTWRDYKEPTSNTYGNVPAFDPGPLENYREWWNDEWREPYQNEHNAPSFRTFLDTHTAAWLPITREGYNGTIVRDRDDLDRVDAIALVSREMFRAWHGIPDGKPMPRGYRQRAAESLKAVIDEYNTWATGDVYGYQVQRHAPDCDECYELPTDEWPDTDCDGWEDTDDSCWGFIGHEYATEAATEAGMLEAGIPIPQVTPDQKGIVIESSPNYIIRYRKGQETIVPDFPQASPRDVASRSVEAGPRPETVSITFYLDPNRDEWSTVHMHRLSWESAQRTMRHLAGRTR